MCVQRCVRAGRRVAHMCAAKKGGKKKGGGARSQGGSKPSPSTEAAAPSSPQQSADESSSSSADQNGSSPAAADAASGSPYLASTSAQPSNAEEGSTNTAASGSSASASEVQQPEAPVKPAFVALQSNRTAGAADPTPASGDLRPAVTMNRPARRSSITAISRNQGDSGGFLPPKLVQKIGLLVAFVAASRIGVYDRLPGVDIAKFSEAVSSNGVLGYIDNITGGSISNVGVFSLGIIPAINASIFLQVLTISFPSLKKMAREDGPQGKARYQLYQKLATLGFATAQAYGQLNALKCATCAPSPAIARTRVRRCHVLSVTCSFTAKQITRLSVFAPNQVQQQRAQNLQAVRN